MRDSQWALKLEELLFGKCDSIEFCEGISREDVIEEINHIIITNQPQAKLIGRFLNPNEAAYMTYDLSVSEGKELSFNSIRVLDFGTKLLIEKI